MPALLLYWQFIVLKMESGKDITSFDTSKRIIAIKKQPLNPQIKNIRLL
jgi:hypothetical protein